MGAYQLCDRGAAKLIHHANWRMLVSLDLPHAPKAPKTMSPFWTDLPSFSPLREVPPPSSSPGRGGGKRWGRADAVSAAQRIEIAILYLQSSATLMLPRCFQRFIDHIDDRLHLDPFRLAGVEIFDSLDPAIQVRHIIFWNIDPQ
jgi:hypothetical protein